MSLLLRSEARKAAATPALWWLLLVTGALAVAGTLPPLLAADDWDATRLTDASLQEALHGAAAGVTLVLVAGIIGIAGEWRFGQATQTFLTTPRRRRVIAAKVIVYTAVGAVHGVAAGLASAATAWGWYRANGLSLPLGRSAVWLTLLGCVAVAVLFGALGVALGAIARNQVLAIVAALGWTSLLEPTLFAASPSVFRWLPGMASFALRRQPTEDLLSVGPATAVVVTVIVAALAIGLRAVSRADVTA
jgi:hypothetical protein